MFKKIVFLCLFALGSQFAAISQDSIPLPKDLTEEKNLKFQSFFYKALSQKAIGNYQRAIGSLESCNEILPNNSTVFFEFSKNYFLLNRADLAKEYIDRALQNKPDDIWMQLHLIKILKKERDFKSAIKVQKRLINTHPKRKEELVYLYLQDRDYKSAIDLMSKMQEEVGLSKNMQNLKKSLELRKSNLTKQKPRNTLQEALEEFNKTNSLANLVLAIEKAETENKTVYHQLTDKGLELYPAQPAAYLYKAKSLNYQNKHKEAIRILQTGIDFVIDDPKMMNNFYRELATSYKSLGNSLKSEEFMNKIKPIN